MKYAMTALTMLSDNGRPSNLIGMTILGKMVWITERNDVFKLKKNRMTFMPPPVEPPQPPINIINRSKNLSVFGHASKSAAV